MKIFRNLTQTDHNEIRSIMQVARSKDDGYRMMMKTFGISYRSAERWAHNLGLTNRRNSIIDEISVIDSKVVHPPSPAKVLIFDIETAPLLSYVWGTWQQNIGHNMGMLEQDWFVLTWAAKWLFDETVYSDKLTPEEVNDENDTRIMWSLWELLEQADIVIAHNGKKFDIKRINTRFLINNIPQPMPYQLIDTLEVARKNFSISSNKLDYIGKILNVGRKVETSGFDLWKRCMKGDSDALLDMEEYNKGDVQLLEDVYLKLRPYVKPHPNIGLFITEDIETCPSCGSSDLERGGSYTTSVNTYEAFRCNSCSSIGRSRKSNIPVGSKSKMLTPVAR